MTTLKPGLHSSLSEAEYHADAGTPSLSSSIAKILIADTPLHAWAAHPRLNPNYKAEEAKHFDLGTICHTIILEGRDAAVIIDAKDYRTKAAQEARDQARAARKCPILHHEYAEVLEMMEACRRQLDAHGSSVAKEIFTHFGGAEQSLVWREPNGVLCRCRIDWLHHSRPLMVDYKTGQASANPRDISRTAASKGWPIQAQFYRRGFKAVFGQDLEPEFWFVAQENYAPFALSITTPSEADYALANAQIEYAVRVFGNCMSTGEWPGYSKRVEEIVSPPYTEVSWLERQER